MVKTEKKSFNKYLRRVYDGIYNWDVLYDLFNLGVWGLFRKYKFSRKLFYKYMKLKYMLSRKVSIPFLSVFVTTMCTLNCKQCCAFVNKYKSENHYKPMRFDDFKNDLDKVLDAVDTVFVFQLVGGEPFLCKDLPKMIRYAKTKKQIKHMFVTTNCTILPSEEMINALKETGTSVEISYYKNAKGVKQYYNEIKELLEKNKIRYSGWLEENGASFISVQDIYEDKNNKKLYLDCFSSKCNTLCDGKFFLCPASVYIYRNVTRQIDSDEVLDIRNSANLKDEFFKFYSKKCHNVCSYCHFNEDRQLSIAGEQE